MSITVIDYGSGNLKSAAKALETAAENLNLDTKIVVTSDPKVIKGMWELPNLEGNWTCWLGRNDYETHSNVGIQCRSKENELIVLHSEIQCNTRNRQKNELGVVYPRSIKNDVNIGKTVIVIECEL